MKSMTGYGIASMALGGGQIVAEIRALNHRYLEVRSTVAVELAAYGHAAEQTLRQSVARGRYDLRLRTTGSTPAALELDVDAAREVHARLVELHREIGASGEVTLAAAIGLLPEPLRAPAVVPAAEDAVRGSVRLAVQSLDEMRDREGACLAAELGASLAAIREHRGGVAARLPSVHHQQRDRLRERVRNLLADTDVAADVGRLETEIALLADRSDITEELVRIDSHVSQLAALLNTSGPVGRKLDFLLQELNREANTLSAKAQDAAITHLGVEMKSEIERMRQQAANIL